jgi:hypothetical protein
MALKDLIADRSKLTEAAIEEIVRDYVRYDPGTFEVVLTPAALALSNDAKILVVLTAIAGWEYVVDEVRPVDTKPAALERTTGIAGGTLRPILKKLKDGHLLFSTSDGYAVRVANLEAIGRVIKGEKATARPAPGKSKRGATRDVAPNEGGGSSSENSLSKSRGKTRVPIRASLARLLDTGFFAEERSLSQVVARLHEMAIIAKTTSLSGPIAELVRSGKLARKKVSEGGKDIWCYRSA